MTTDLIDPAHANLDFTSGHMTQEIWKDKYRWEDETSFFESIPRIVGGVYANDTRATAEIIDEIQELMRLGLWMPAGRIMAGAGTTKLVTLLNCFVNGTIEDNMKSITDHCSYMVLTMQQGGGMGTAFETIRPANAILKRTGTGARASGPLPFIAAWDTWGKTVESAGGRRGAQMWTISDTHPDMPAFTIAKRQQGVLTNGNMSINISDAFMSAVAEDEEWPLYFDVPPVNQSPELAEQNFIDDEGIQQYVYSVWKARDLYELITKNTYEYSEPGIIFMDRVNEINNLWYCETIRATNPCGEQPLPPNNACDLGHNNLARMVRNPFTMDAYFDFELLRKVTKAGVRFLDNIWDVTNFPLEQQREECLSKRRIGLGFTGLADVFAQMQIRYGSIRSAELAERITQVMCEAAYEASVDLAIEKGPFPLFDADKYLASNTFAGSRLPIHIQQRIREHGIRNGVLLTIAPTGTSSIVYGNPQGGLEPFFALTQKRSVLQPDGSRKPYIEHPYAVRLWKETEGRDQEEVRNDTVEFPSYFNTMASLNVHEHILIQSRCQRWIDASISKTTNIPKEMSYEEFVKVYDLAYTSGCKGCTTYRPSDVRGSVLEDASTKSTNGVPLEDGISASVSQSHKKRPTVLHGSTYQIKWPRRNSALYLTINSDEHGLPREVFIVGKDGTASEWTTALSLMITAIFRKGGDIDFVSEELQQIQSINDVGIQPVNIRDPQGRKRFFLSLPAYIGYIIQQHLEAGRAEEATKWQELKEGVQKELEEKHEPENALPWLTQQGGICPECHTPGLVSQEGCEQCSNCGYSKCG